MGPWHAASQDSRRLKGLSLSRFQLELERSSWSRCCRRSPAFASTLPTSARPRVLQSACVCARAAPEQTLKGHVSLSVSRNAPTKPPLGEAASQPATPQPRAEAPQGTESGHPWEQSAWTPRLNPECLRTRSERSGLLRTRHCTHGVSLMRIVQHNLPLKSPTALWTCCT